MSLTYIPFCNFLINVQVVFKIVAMAIFFFFHDKVQNCHAFLIYSLNICKSCLNIAICFIVACSSDMFDWQWQWQRYVFSQTMLFWNVSNLGWVSYLQFATCFYLQCWSSKFMCDARCSWFWSLEMFMDIAKKRRWTWTILSISKGWKALVMILKLLESQMFQKKRFVKCMAPSLTKMAGSTS